MKPVLNLIKDPIPGLIRKIAFKGEKIKRDISDGTLNCLEMGMAFLRNEKDLTAFTPVMLMDFINVIMDIWEPEEGGKGEERKKETLLELRRILAFLHGHITEYVKAVKVRQPTTYKDVKPIFEKWQKHIDDEINGILDLKFKISLSTIHPQ